MLHLTGVKHLSGLLFVLGITKLLGHFAVGRQGITPEEVQAWEADLAEVNKAGEYFYSASQYLFLIEKN